MSSTRTPDVFTYVDGVGTVSIRKMIEELAEVDDLPDGVKDFVDSMADSLKSWQGSTNWVSTNQRAAIERVYKKQHEFGNL
jgi:hypothetical protein